METITINNLIGGVATFNADPFEIATEETAQDIINSIEEYGVDELTDENDIEVANAQLDLDDDDERPIYLTNDCKFVLRQEPKIIEVEVCPSDKNILAAEVGRIDVQCTLFEEQKLSYKECVEQFKTAVNICGADADRVQAHMDLNGVSCTIETYYL